MGTEDGWCGLHFSETLQCAAPVDKCKHQPIPFRRQRHLAHSACLPLVDGQYVKRMDFHVHVQYTSNKHQPLYSTLPCFYHTLPYLTLPLITIPYPAYTLPYPTSTLPYPAFTIPGYDMTVGEFNPHMLLTEKSLYTTVLYIQYLCLHMGKCSHTIQLHCI